MALKYWNLEKIAASGEKSTDKAVIYVHICSPLLSLIIIIFHKGVIYFVTP